ncbi:phosphoribosylamine--glycine ligase [Rhodocaloribacter litoris]|uniref:phosphoribosylamine--glycine ligase n=1 Tax=Rhodocaloribacter litoris TaxID=2558931 RepID=UPI00141F3242|nr:phosphoribosylamine--glycine ligase [Rhodocaloribacter litoris]QXD15968.1 phosphoribosylamine--glycine ligase [Rhodocaloribacter litoris]
MRILIVGSGGREHALAWGLAQSPERPELYIAPGNAGTETLGENVPVAADDLDGLLALARERRVDLVVVGPEQPLVAGLVDRLEAAGVPVVGPTAAAARLEGSKAFAKAFMQRHGIPTAAHRTFTARDYDAAVAYLDAVGAPVVVKASGLAAGKGAVVCSTRPEARAALDAMLREGRFGAAGDEVVIEEYMQGEEASVFALTDGTDYVLLAPAQDHKRIGEGDTGPNTGGMGAYAPAPVVTEAVLARVRREIVEPTLRGMAAEGHPYRGILYVGLMITEDGPKVVEYNCRLGDPEAQVVIPLLAGDLAVLFDRLARGRLREVNVALRPAAAACVVLASQGYPGTYQKGFVIEGLDEAGALDDVLVLHAGTRRRKDGAVVTAGGRVLAVTALAPDLAGALEKAYRGAGLIRFEGKYYRRDIGRKGLLRLRQG